MPKDVVSSVHMKYKRRLCWLVHALNQFIDAAETKLDRSQGGRVHHREKIQLYLAKSKELAELLPELDEIRRPLPLPDDFLDRLAQATPVEEILAEAKKFFSEMDPEEREQLKGYMANLRGEEDPDSDENEDTEADEQHWLDQLNTSNQRP